jgi:D-threo-aldose 1-dehydrogenase
VRPARRVDHHRRTVQFGRAGRGRGPGRTTITQPAPPEIIDRVGRLEAVCAAHGVPLAAAALQFPLAHPVVASVIPGMGSPAQARQAVAWLETAIPDGLWDDLRSEGLLHPDAPTPAERVTA